MIASSTPATNRIVLNYPNRQMTFQAERSERVADDGCSGRRIPFEPDFQGWPVSGVDTELGRLTFVWDTGAPVNIIRSELAGAQGNAFTLQKFAMGGQEYGPMRLTTLSFAEPEGIAGFIGTEFFSRHVVCVDLPNRAFHVKAHTAIDGPPDLK